MAINMRPIAAGPIEEAFATGHLQQTYGGRLATLESAATSLLRSHRGARG